MRYLIYCVLSRREFAVIDADPSLTAEDYGRIQEDFMRNYGADRHDHPVMRRLYNFHKIGSMYYDESIVSKDGAAGTLFVFPGTDPEEIKAAKAHILAKGDIVRFETIQLKREVEFNPAETD